MGILEWVVASRPDRRTSSCALAIGGAPAPRTVPRRALISDARRCCSDRRAAPAFVRFDSLLEARVIIEDWRIDYNPNGPHTAHGDLTPAEFAAARVTTNQPQVA